MTLRSRAKFEEKRTRSLENDTRNLASFHQNTSKCQNWYFREILLSKVENTWAKNLQRSYVWWHWRMMKNLKMNWLVVLKLTLEIWQILTRELKSLKNLHFDRLLLTKVYHVSAEKSTEEFYFMTLECDAKFEENDLWFGKWHEKFGKLLTDHTKVSKLRPWWHPFVYSWKCMSLKIKGKLCVMTMKNDAKIE